MLYNRTNIVDQPIVAAILNTKYSNSNIKFMLKNGLHRGGYGSDMLYSVNGVTKKIVTVRNSSKHWDSRNFILTFNKNSLDIFNNSVFAFIDELYNFLYVVNSEALLKYIVNNHSNVRESSTGNSHYILIPKREVAGLAAESGTLIKYDKKTSSILEACRDESVYNKLV